MSDKSEKIKCPNCGSEKYSREKNQYGNSICLDCNFFAPTATWEYLIIKKKLQTAEEKIEQQHNHILELLTLCARGEFGWKDKEFASFRNLENFYQFEEPLKETVLVSNKIKFAEQKLQAAEEREKILMDAVEFYATFTPYQFPEGYYEICIEEGMGGHNKFGTIARQALEKVEGGE